MRVLHRNDGRAGRVDTFSQLAALVGKPALQKAEDAVVTMEKAVSATPG
jgi:hypothetical protein